MRVHYLKSNNLESVDCELDVPAILALIEHPQSSYITVNFSDEISLDFHPEDDGTIWLEVYQPSSLYESFISLAEAEKILNAAECNFGNMPVDEYLMSIGV